MKRILIITFTSIACLVGLYIFITWNGRGNPDFMHYRYNKVVTEPLAKLGFANAQYKMGLYWFYGSGESELTKAELDNAIYWLGKASEKGNKDAQLELSKAIRLE